MVSGWCQDGDKGWCLEDRRLANDQRKSRSRSRRMLPASAALIADTGHWLGWSHSLPGGVVPLSRSNCSGATVLISGNQLEKLEVLLSLT